MLNATTHRQHLIALIIAGATLLLTASLLIPAQLFLANSHEVSIAVTDVWKIAWPLPLGLAVLVLVVGLAGRKAILSAAACFLMALALALYLQGNLLVRDYGVFDGTDIEWGRHQGAAVLESVVWLGLLAGSLIFHRRCRRHIPAIALAVIVLQVGALGYQLASGRSLDARIDQAEVEDMFAFSAERNVLFILLDGFPAPTFDRLLERDEALTAQLDGFIYFRDTAGVSPYTLLSIPTIFSGQVYDNSETVQDFKDAAFDDRSLPRVMERNGFRTHIVTAGLYGRHLSGIPYRKADSYGITTPLEADRRDALKIWDVALFRYAPHYLKRHVYRDHAWLLQRTLLPAPPVTDSRQEVEGTGSAGEPMSLSEAQLASSRLWDRSLADAEATSDTPTFKFLHFFTSHPPYVMDEAGRPLSREQYQSRHMYDRCLDQCDFSIERVRQLLDKLRELRVLDQTMVVVLADHGSNAGQRGFSTPINRGLPLLLVKPIGAHGRLRTSPIPASLLDVPATVATALGLDADYPGWPLLAEAPDTSRVRPYYYFTWEKRFWHTDYLPSLTEYDVIGPAWERRSWREKRTLTGKAP